MIRLILILAIGMAAWLIYSLYLKRLLSQGRQGKLKIALIALGFVLVLLALTGRASILFAFIGAAMTQIMRLAPLLIRFFPVLKQFAGQRNVFQNRPSQQSRVRSEMLAMTLDHDSGHIDGEVLQGQFAGRGLLELNQQELQQLLAECQQHDPEGVRLLQAFVARVHGGENWGEDPGSSSENHANNEQTGTHARPSINEAGDILGISAAASRDEIIAAHRKLMGRVHPDKGGSNYLAAKINAAKEVLLDQASRDRQS